jgi:hypothetical protein
MGVGDCRSPEAPFAAPTSPRSTVILGTRFLPTRMPSWLRSLETVRVAPWCLALTRHAIPPNEFRADPTIDCGFVLILSS